MQIIKTQLINQIKKLPLSLIFTISLVCLYSFILLYSAAGGSIYPWAFKQILIFLIFLPISIIIALMDIKLIYQLAYPFYLISLISVIIVEFFGKSAMGATRWLDLGIISIQPSELIKIALVLMLARYFHANENKKSDFWLIPAIIAAIIPILLVIKQPDLGTGIITLMVVTIMFFLSGVNWLYFLGLGVTGLLAMPIIWSAMHAYQQNRVLTFLNPENDPLGTGYNIIQSKIAIGSGGFWGKGLLSGTQSHLKFLPEYQTDFIFSFLMEELGFIGGILLIILYIIIITQSTYIAINCKSRFANLMCLGITFLFFAHMFINIAMVMGLLPVVGVPLPLISYGRTMVASMLIGFGLIMNGAINRNKKNIC